MGRMCAHKQMCAPFLFERHLLIPLRVGHLLLLDPSLECAMIIQLVTGDRSILKSTEIWCFSCEGWQKKQTELYIHFYFKTKPAGCLLIMMKENTIMFQSIHPNTKQCQSFTVDYILKCPLTPKYFFCLNKYLHLFETNCAFLNLVVTFFTL